MLRFVIQKMLNKKWMVLSLLIGNILLISIAAANPLYTNAVLQRTLTTYFSNYVAENNRYPMTYVVRFGGLSNKDAAVEKTLDHINESMYDMGVPVLDMVGSYSVGSSQTISDLDRTDRRSVISINALTNLNDHIEIVAGTYASPEKEEDGSIQVVVSETGLQEMGMLLGEHITYKTLKDPDDNYIKIHVVGVFKNKDDSDPYWVQPPGSYQYTVFMNEDLYSDMYLNGNVVKSISAVWYILYDYTALSVDQVRHVMNTVTDFNDYYSNVSNLSSFNYFEVLLNNYTNTMIKVRTTFLVMQIPVLILLAAFIFMVSKQMLDMEQGEIAVLKSRGASKKQIIGIYFVQSAVTVLISIFIGIPLSFLLVQILGSANAFLEFVSRKSLKLQMSMDTVLYVLAAAVLSVLAMVIPVFRHSNVTIVNHKQRKHRKSDAPFWQKFFLDIIILLISLYGLYNFNAQKEYISQMVLQGKALDPLLFLSASLFILGAGLFALRIIPLLSKLVFVLFKKQWSPALYTSFVHITRNRKQQGFIMVFLIMTIAIGVFNASAARTINNNDEQNLYYTTGADVVIQERWESNATLVAMDPDLPLEYREPDYGHYSSLVGNGADSVTRVQVEKDLIVNAGSGVLKDAQVMGINTKEFGKTAWFDKSLLPEHWYNYLNAMAQNSNAILVSSNFKDNYGYKIGDVINIRFSGESTLRGIIYGFVDYWPSYSSKIYTKDFDGLYKENDNYLIVAHMSTMQQLWGIRPYEVWIKSTGSTEFIYDMLDQYNIDTTKMIDTSAELVKHKNDAVLQGTNGLLTVGFIVALVLCTVGFLIYWILSIRSRELQFGIFRAMGMSMGEIIAMLLNEHIFISGTSIAAGVLVGLLASKLFMPLIQIAYSSVDYALPLRIVNETSDGIRLAVIIGLMVVICLLILAWIIRSMKIAQALKLGED